MGWGCFNCGSNSHFINQCPFERCLRCFEKLSHCHDCTDKRWEKRFFGAKLTYQEYAVSVIQKYGENVGYSKLKFEKERLIVAVEKFGEDVEYSEEKYKKNLLIFSYDVNEGDVIAPFKWFDNNKESNSFNKVKYDSDIPDLINKNDFDGTAEAQKQNCLSKADFEVQEEDEDEILETKNECFVDEVTGARFIGKFKYFRVKLVENNRIFWVKEENISKKCKKIVDDFIETLTSSEDNFTKKFQVPWAKFISKLNGQ